MAEMSPSPVHPRDLLRDRGLFARRSLGQNFLLSDKVAARIVEEARVGPGDVVLEIGTGLGNLTGRLAAKARAVITVEIDRGLCEIAAERLAGCPNVKLLCADFLESKHRINPAVTEAVRSAGGGRPVKVVSNLPYQISSPAIVNMLEWETPVAEMDVMLQREVVERLMASAGTAQYGPLTVFVTCLAEVERLFSLPPNAFWPRPAVWSDFVRIVPRPPRLRAHDYRTFSEVVNKLFQSRRKTLARALEQGWGRESARKVLDTLGLDRAQRPERLSLEDFIRIADVLSGALPMRATE